jgi:DNA-binding NtrC family response regulator
LANVIERAQILAENNRITLDDLPDNLHDANSVCDATDCGQNRNLLRDVERRHVREMLEQNKGNKVHTARALGISRRALYRLLDKYHIE